MGASLGGGKWPGKRNEFNLKSPKVRMDCQEMATEIEEIGVNSGEIGAAPAYK